MVSIVPFSTTPFFLLDGLELSSVLHVALLTSGVGEKTELLPRLTSLDSTLLMTDEGRGSTPCIDH